MECHAKAGEGSVICESLKAQDLQRRSNSRGTRVDVVQMKPIHSMKFRNNSQSGGRRRAAAAAAVMVAWQAAWERRAQEVPALSTP